MNLSKLILLPFIGCATILVVSCSQVTSPQSLIDKYQSNSHRTRHATITADLQYQGVLEGFHYIQFTRGGLGRIKVYRLSSDVTRSDIQLPYTDDKRSWVRCMICRSHIGDGFIIKASRDYVSSGSPFKQIQ